MIVYLTTIVLVILKAMSKISLTLIFFLAVLLFLPETGSAIHDQKKRSAPVERGTMAQVQDQLIHTAFYDYYPPEKKAEYYGRFNSPPNALVLLQLYR